MGKRQPYKTYNRQMSTKKKKCNQVMWEDIIEGESVNKNEEVYLILVKYTFHQEKNPTSIGLNKKEASKYLNKTVNMGDLTTHPSQEVTDQVKIKRERMKASIFQD